LEILTHTASESGVLTLPSNVLGGLDCKHSLQELLNFSGVESKWWGEIFQAADCICKQPREWESWTNDLSLPPVERKIHESGGVPSEWKVLYAIRQVGKMRVLHEEMGMPVEITESTARDLPIWLDEVGGPSAPLRDFPFRWFDNHARGDLLRVGRLEFHPSCWEEIFDVFADGDDLETLVAVAHEGIACNENGWPVEREPAFVTTREESMGQIRAHVASTHDGSISREPVGLRVNPGEPVFRKGTPVLQVHIPAGEPLETEPCVESLRRAGEVFHRYFPSLAWRGYCCDSWLLDRELWHILPEDSGVRRFAELFRPLAVSKPDDCQLIERVFGNAHSLEDFQPRTSLQKKILDHMRAGGVFRRTSGYIL